MANGTVQSGIAELALSQQMSGEAERKSSLLNGMLTAFASVLSGYFILAAGSSTGWSRELERWEQRFSRAPS